ncbi:MAG TPA: TraR/DksA family transcriptional regulator [Gammaproteobacteria bacterium]|nr:TraR/DksA family transcriptional regulator [Gammaproteobacteria bacterium]
MTDFSKYESKLLALRNELTERVRAINKDLHHEEIAIEKDFAEQVTQLENDEVLNLLSDEAKARVMQIDKALLRIKNATFGRCSVCNAEINPQRLDAIPYAELCISCAQQQ